MLEWLIDGLGGVFAALSGLSSALTGRGEVVAGVWESIRDFLELGGEVLAWIMVLVLLMWMLIAERMLYFLGPHRTHVRAALADWEARSERRSWYAHRIREQAISELRNRSEFGLGLIQAMVALCPLLGLLGTVTGMIEVFEVMAIAGTGNPRSMAAGVSKATIPTMAGMVAALSGLFFASWLKQKSKRQVMLFSEHLTMDHSPVQADRSKARGNEKTFQSR